MRKVFIVVMALAVLMAAAGCSSLQKNKETSPAPVAQQEPLGSYHEFEDVLIPKDMELDTKRSFVFETPQYKTGILVYEGRVEAVSLSNFLEKNMIQDNWHMRSKMKYNRTIMVFEKADRDCIINIEDETFKTVLEVIVAPRMETPKTQGGGNAIIQAPPAEENLAQ